MARRRFRKVNGILLLDKPAGVTSNAALQQVKHLFSAAKAGHTGSLDPLATGMLPLCFGMATKMSAFLLDADKRYQVTFKLGVRTATADAEGDVIETRPVPALDTTAMESIMDNYRGEIQQVPPMYSALKHKGERLYNLARKGIEVERESRPVTIFSMELVSLSADEGVIDVHCSKGTYVRTLVDDIGEDLGCGAHVTALRRLTVGPFEEVGMVTMETVLKHAEQGFSSLDELLLPVETAVADWPRVELVGDAAFYIRQGQPVVVAHAPTSGSVGLFVGDTGEFIGVGEIHEDGRVAPKRLFAA